MRVVIVLAKAPVPGRVKTRLSPPLTPEQAADVAAAALADTFSAALLADRADAVVAVFEGDPTRWVPENVITLPQVDGGLDLRLAAAFNDVHERESATMVLIAMDTPQVTAALLDEAFDALDRPNVDAVFGPADDGGYWLIGLRPLRPDESSYDALFHDVPMSTEHTGVAQHARLVSLGWSVHTIASLRDIDTVDDIAAVVSGAPELTTARVWRGILSAEGPAGPILGQRSSGAIENHAANDAPPSRSRPPRPSH
jgi:uncharacterized protein